LIPTPYAVVHEAGLIADSENLDGDACRSGYGRKKAQVACDAALRF
jgi:hypothetical protein